MTKQATNQAYFAYGMKYSNIGLEEEEKNILQYIQDKKQEKNIIRLGMNEEMRQDINKTQLSKHVKP